MATTPRSRPPNNALVAAVGAARAGRTHLRLRAFQSRRQPAAPLTKSGVALSVAFVVFPPDPVTTLQSWSQAPQVRQFPDRFVVLGYSGTHANPGGDRRPRDAAALYAGPILRLIRPSIRLPASIPTDADLYVPDQLQWMVDFDRAVAAGMGDGDSAHRRASSRQDSPACWCSDCSSAPPPADGPAALQELLAHHQWSRSGFFLVPQGTPAHNTTGADAGSTPRAMMPTRASTTARIGLCSRPSPTRCKEGWSVAGRVSRSRSCLRRRRARQRGSDQMQARAMQTALWPATLGLLDANAVHAESGDNVHLLGQRHRADARLLHLVTSPAAARCPRSASAGSPTAFCPAPLSRASRGIAKTPGAQRASPELPGIALQPAAADRRRLDGDEPAVPPIVGKAGDPHQTLLDILALNPSSVEYYSRNAEEPGATFQHAELLASVRAGSPRSRISVCRPPRSHCCNGSATRGSALPDLLNHYFLTDNPQITTIIDDRPLSETSPDPRLHYRRPQLHSVAHRCRQRPRSTPCAQKPASRGNQSPQALLYLYLRHALMLGYYDTSYNFHRNAGVLYRRPQLCHAHGADLRPHCRSAGTSESRFAALYKTESRDHRKPYAAGQRLHPRATARCSADGRSGGASRRAQDSGDGLHRRTRSASSPNMWIFARTVMTRGCSRWSISTSPRSKWPAPGNQQKARSVFRCLCMGRRIFIPSTDHALPAQLPAGLAAQFPGTAPLMTDANNGGYIHAPSIPHADAAAVLRAGILSGRVGGTQLRRTRRQSFLRSGASGHDVDRRDPQRTEPGSAARLSVRTRSA